MQIRVTVVGAGSWGTTVAALAANNTPTTLWARDSELAEQIDTEHVNERYLPGFGLPDALCCTGDLERAVRARGRGGHGGAVARVPRHARSSSRRGCVRGCRW